MAKEREGGGGGKQGKYASYTRETVDYLLTWLQFKVEEERKELLLAVNQSRLRRYLTAPMEEKLKKKRVESWRKSSHATSIRHQEQTLDGQTGKNIHRRIRRRVLRQGHRRHCRPRGPIGSTGSEQNAELRDHTLTAMDFCPSGTEPRTAEATR